jgi:5'-nucleotidase
VTLDRRSRDVVEVSANNQIVTQHVFKATDLSDLIARYTTIAAPLRDRVIGRIAGGVRSEFTFAQSGTEGDGNVTYGEAFTVQPFGNSLVTLTLTGAQLLEMLKQQWCGQDFARVLLPSAAVSYSYSLSAAAALVGQPCAGAANPVSNLTIGGVAVDPAATYRITVNSFLAEGGDRFTVLADGTDRLGGAVDTDALEAYIAPSLTGAPVAPPALDRVDVLP